MKRSRARLPEAISFARDERARSNDFAATIWQWVRNRQICNQKFRRQYPIPPYTADFCCVELQLILEVDGAEHFTEEGKSAIEFAMISSPERVTESCGSPRSMCYGMEGRS